MACWSVAGTRNEEDDIHQVFVAGMSCLSANVFVAGPQAGHLISGILDYLVIAQVGKEEDVLQVRKEEDEDVLQVAHLTAGAFVAEVRNDDEED